MTCEKCENPDDGGSGICDQCFDDEIMSMPVLWNVPLIPAYVMIHEGCGGQMLEAPLGSLNLACMKCGLVKYGGSNDE
jgi:hypothetical protein